LAMLNKCIALFPWKSQWLTKMRFLVIGSLYPGRRSSGLKRTKIQV
jgi:hypothetical protein